MIPKYEDEIATLGSDVASKSKQLYEATALRKKEKADFDAAEGELMTSIDQLDRAVTIIKREMSTITEFAQGAPGAKSRKEREVEVAVKVLSKIIDSGHIRTSTKRQIEGLLQTGTMDDLTFKHRQPQATSVAYESKSGGIVEKIEELKEEAEESLSGTRSAEMKAVQDFKMLEQSLSNGITVATDQISTAKSALGLTTEELNKAKGDLGETEASKAADEKTLAELKHECEETAANWAARQESASAEMAAINKAIEVLSEGVRVLLQTKSSKRSRNVLDKYDDQDDSPAPVDSMQPVRQRLADTLKGMSKKFGSYALMEMAGSAVSDPFVKIRGLIEDMIAKLLKEAQEEATQKAFCDEEMGKSKASEKEKTMTLDKLNSRIDKASARVAELTEAIKTLESEVAELDAATAEATKIRTEEAETNAKAIKDFGDAAAATEKAIKILKDFYDNAALIQTGSKTRRSDDSDDQPELGSAKSDAGSVIIGILEMSNEDFVKMHSETSTSEAEAVEQYEKLINDNKASKAAKLAEVKGSQSEVKSLKVALEQHGEDKSMTSTELDAVLEYLEKLKPQCEEKVMSYAEKKARREAEIAGLKEALEILSSEIALVQKGRSLRRVHAH